ncbi:unnamed protein product, partial [Rotaria sp. Silwood2]
MVPNKMFGTDNVDFPPSMMDITDDFGNVQTPQSFSNVFQDAFRSSNSADRVFIEIGDFQSNKVRTRPGDWSSSAFVRAQKKKKKQITNCKILTRTRNNNFIDTMEIIDLCTPPIVIDDLSTIPDPMYDATTSVEMKQRFLNLDRRLCILPCYPTYNANRDQGQPLLANIPHHQLTPTELSYRRSGAFKPACTIVNSQSNMPSFLRAKFNMFFGDLLERLKVDLSILDYNYTRLNKFMKMLAYEQIRAFNLPPNAIPQIEEKEYPVVLEFFLQFDVNMFYMKTCSFRYTRPRTLNEGLFCLQEPEARYELAACGNCALCYPQYDMTYRLKKSVVEFSQAHKHTFLNGYQAILNCSASCHTSNIIYALTCPCGKFEYIGTTANTLHDRLKKHREHGNRIIHEFLIGQTNILRELTRGKPTEILVKDRMKLYQHSARCPVAMQIFLDANQPYWRFVPMSLEESQRPEQQMVQRLVISDEPSHHARTRRDCEICVDAVPKPSKGYIF